MRLLKTMQDWCRMVSQQLSILTEADVGVPVAKMRELAHAAADKVYIDDNFNDGGFHDNIRTSLSFITSTFSTISCALVDGQYGVYRTALSPVTNTETIAIKFNYNIYL